ncbi:MAG: prolyl oligopeptidase family serine peptidase [Chloroflexota bacterium]|nr:prolyl oligopeptidase family serine peptidase [Chloroflexota bacterium]
MIAARPIPWLIPLILLTLSCASGPSAPLESAAPAAAQPVAPALVATTQVASTAPALIPPPATATPTLVPTPAPTPTPINLPVPQGTADAPEDAGDQRTIAGLRARPYESGPLEIVRTLATTPTYTSYFITYPSDGLRVTGYLNVPRGDGPFPVLLVNHGYVNPMGYVAVASNYTKREGDFLATRGYLTAGSDYRGHGNSPGTAVGAHLETAYAIDTLNLLAALKAFPQADTARVGVWGHSNGGSISERIMVVSKDVDATVIWAGVSADAVDAWLYLRDWIRRPEREVRERYGHPDEQPDLFRRMSARHYLAEIAGPVQIHHGTADASVPYAHAVSLDRALTAAGKPHQLLTYPGAPHNWFGATWDTAMGRTVAYFDANVRG